MYANGNSWGSSAAGVREDGVERPGNTWLFTARAIGNKHAIGDI
jgi:hypothetical protein